MKRLLFPIILSLLLLTVPSASAHPGRTDSSGGHTDRSTGEYHYHHGYEEHQHYDMNGDGIKDCPYDFKDKTGSSSGSSSSSSGKSKATTSTSPPATKSTEPPTTTPAPIAATGPAPRNYITDPLNKPASTTPTTSSGYTPLSFTGSSKSSSQKSPSNFLLITILLLLFSFFVYMLIRLYSRNTEQKESIDSLYSNLHKKEREIKEIFDSCASLVGDEMVKNKVLEDKCNELETLCSELESKNGMLESQCQQLGILLTDTDHAKALLSLSIDQYKAERTELVLQLQHTYGKDFLLPLSGAPRGTYIDNACLPHRFASKGDDQYMLHRSGTGKFHAKSCTHYSSCVSIHALDVPKDEFNRNRCQICNPQYPDLTWYKKYLHFIDITK